MRSFNIFLSYPKCSIKLQDSVDFQQDNLNYAQQMGPPRPEVHMGGVDSVSSFNHQMAWQVCKNTRSDMINTNQT